MQVEHAVELGDREHASDAVLWADQAEVTVVAPDSLQAGDDHAEPGRIQERKPAEIEHYIHIAVGNESHHALPQ